MLLKNVILLTHHFMIDNKSYALAGWRCLVTVHIVGTQKIQGSLDVSLQGSSKTTAVHTIYRHVTVYMGSVTKGALGLWGL